MKREEFISLIRSCIKRADMEPWCYISDDRYEEATLYVDEQGDLFVCSKKTVYNVSDVEDVKYRGTIAGLEQGELCNYIKIYFRNGDILKLSFWDEIELMVKNEGGYSKYWYIKALEHFDRQINERDKSGACTGVI